MGKILADDIFRYFYLQRIKFGISCKLAPEELICMKYQNPFSWTAKKFNQFFVCWINPESAKSLNKKIITCDRVWRQCLVVIKCHESASIYTVYSFISTRVVVNLDISRQIGDQYNIQTYHCDKPDNPTYMYEFQWRDMKDNLQYILTAKIPTRFHILALFFLSDPLLAQLSKAQDELLWSLAVRRPASVVPMLYTKTF